ncbi:type IV pilus assembly protein PilE [Acinetobacter calcoaceticus]|uniref:Type IV pilus assembly protein PilE n=1 Tax=Acinetobacter calcoaceticus TaxID=471 RepID=A0A4R1Y6V0_ACICA|nr:type IV pilus assembly protein PilE [Acinetobacter calcoaceticus]
MTEHVDDSDHTAHMDHATHIEHTAAQLGFTLIEFLIALVLIAILICLALPNYQAYLERKDLALAKQHSLRIAASLEQFKARNFSYRGFNLADVYPSFDAESNILLLPVGSAPDDAKYILSVVDYDSLQALDRLATQSESATTAAANNNSSSQGRAWVIQVERAKSADGQYRQPRNFDLLLSSTGLRCMTHTANQVSGYRSCGTTNSEPWS